MQGLDRRAGLDPELVVEGLPQSSGMRPARPPDARRGRARASAWACRCSRSGYARRGRRGREHGVVAERHLRLDPGLRWRPRAARPAELPPGHRLDVGEVGQHVTAPQGRGPPRADAGAAPGRRERRAAGAHQLLEAPRVDGLVGLQAVATRDGDDEATGRALRPCRLEHLAQMEHVRLQGAGQPGGGRSPDGVGDPVRGNGRRSGEEQAGENRPLPPTAERNCPVSAADLERAEDPQPGRVEPIVTSRSLSPTLHRPSRHPSGGYRAAMASSEAGVICRPTTRASDGQPSVKDLERGDPSRVQGVSEGPACLGCTHIARRPTPGIRQRSSHVQPSPVTRACPPPPSPSRCGSSSSRRRRLGQGRAGRPRRWFVTQTRTRHRGPVDWSQLAITAGGRLRSVSPPPWRSSSSSTAPTGTRWPTPDSGRRTPCSRPRSAAPWPSPV